MSSSSPLPLPEALLAHQRFLRAIVRSLLRGADGDDDVVQEAMVRAWQSAPTQPQRFRSWLGRIAHNLSLDHLRTTRRARVLHRQAAAREGAPSPEEVLLQEEQRRRVVQAVVSLPQPYRSVVLLRFWEDLTPAEIAVRLAIPSATARSQLLRGLAMLREQLDGDYGSRRAWLAALTPFAGFENIPRAMTWGTLVMAMTKTKVVGVAAVLLMAGVAVWLSGVLAPLPTAPIADGIASAVASPASATLERTNGANVGPPPQAVSRVASETSGALAVRGQVLNQGAPFPGITLTLQWFDGFTTSGAPASEFQVPCDREGRFEWRGPLRTAPGMVAVMAPRQRVRLWCAGELVVPNQTEAMLKVTVIPLDRVLSGRVHDSAGAPIAGARLSVNLWPESEVRTGPDGRYEIGVPPAGYPLLVCAAGFRNQLVNGYMPAGAMRHEFDIEMVPGARIEGRVVDASGSPLAAAKVRGMFEVIESDADGRFVIDGAVQGRREELMVSKPGFQETRTSGVGGGEPVTVVMQPGLTMALRVVDRGGAAIAGAAVSRVSMSGATRLGLTTLDGRLALTDLSAQPTEIMVEKVGFVTARQPVDPREQREELTITLLSGCAIRGRVVDDAGQPVAGASIYCQLGRSVTGPVSIEKLPKSVGSRANSDVEGRFEVNELPPEQCTLFAHHPDYTRAEFVFVAGAVAETTLRLTRAPSIAGVVFDAATGAPIPKFTVEVRPARDFSFVGLDPAPFQSPDGRFRLRDWRLRTGVALTVVVAADGYAATTFVSEALVAPPPDQNVVRLGVGMRVEGVVRDPASGDPVAGVTVELVRDDPRLRPNEGPATDASGRFAIESVPAGEQRLRLQHEQRPEVVFGPFPVGAGPGTLEVRPTMGVGVSLRGRVIGASDAAGLEVLAYRADGRIAKATVRTDLTFEVKGLGTGPTWVNLTDRSGRECARRIAVGERDVDGFEFALRAGPGAIRIEVDGAVAEMVEVQRVDAAGATLASDSLRPLAAPVVVDGLAAGHYRVIVHTKNGSRSVEVDVGAVEVPARIECRERK